MPMSGPARKRDLHSEAGAQADTPGLSPFHLMPLQTARGRFAFFVPDAEATGIDAVTMLRMLETLRDGGGITATDEPPIAEAPNADEPCSLGSGTTALKCGTGADASGVLSVAVGTNAWPSAGRRMPR